MSARRLHGEALTLAQLVSGEHGFLGSLTRADGAGGGEATRGLTVKLAAAHSRRMSQLGLAG